MKTLAFVVGFLGLIAQSNAEYRMPHEMQHGFVLAADDRFVSHLVATGHHSRQAEITGQLSIDDPQETKFYDERKSTSAGRSYFLFQAQSLDLPSLKGGQVLTGHIIESKIGDYEPKNIIVKKAIYKVDKVLLNIENPFFGDQ